MMADPVGIENDWYLIEETVKEGLKDIKSGQELFVEDDSLILKSKTKFEKIFDFAQKKHDVYLITQNGKEVIIIFNHVEQILYKSDLNNISFQALDWKFNNLMTIIKSCKTEKYKLDYFLIEYITDNSFLVDFPVAKRPKEMKCGYFIGGGRCELAYDSKTDEWEKYNMMLLNYDLKYVGDITSIGSIYKDEKVCELYDKISNF
jgi:hypothetical protein